MRGEKMRSKNTNFPTNHCHIATMIKTITYHHHHTNNNNKYNATMTTTSTTTTTTPPPPLPSHLATSSS